MPELFTQGSAARPPRATGSFWAWLFNRIDDVLRVIEPHLPAASRRRAIDRAVAFVGERLNGDDGLGGIYPAIANSVMMYECLGRLKNDPNLLTAKSALKKLCLLYTSRCV